MLNKSDLKKVIHQKGISKTNIVLICLASEGEENKEVKDIKEIGKGAGVRNIVKWNISTLLRRSNGKAIRTDKGWELTDSGITEVRSLIGSLIGGAPQKIAVSLRSHLSQIKDKQSQAFIEEAISCLETRLFRAAVVLSWVGAVAVLYDHVVKTKLSDFNREGKRKFQKWKEAKTKDDLANMKESEFLEILQGISVIGKSVKDELGGCLKFRNGCGHPNSLKIGENRVSGHIETLIQNVFSVFSK